MRAVALATVSLLLVAAAPANLIGLIERDYTGNTTATDRTWFYRLQDGTPKTDGNGFFPPVEWKGHTHPHNVPGVVYVKSSVAMLKLTWSNPQLAALEGDLNVLGLRLKVPPVTPGKPFTYIPLSASGSTHLELPAEGGQDSVTLTITGLPAHVSRGVIELNAKVIGSNILWNTGGYMPMEAVYVTDSVSTGDQSTPWLEVLGMGCDWARGRSGSTPVARAVTQGLYDFGQFFYNPSGTWFWQTDGNPLASTGHTFKLKALLEVPKPVSMGCADVSGLVQLTLHALGVSAKSVWISAGDAIPDWSSEPVGVITRGLKTNPICGVGFEPKLDEFYEEFLFAYHQFNLVGGLAYDAAAAHRLDLDGIEYRQPPKEWIETPYVQKPWSNPPYLGMFKGYADSTIPELITPLLFDRILDRIW